MKYVPRRLAGFAALFTLAAAGCSSGSSGKGNQEPPPDTTAPTVSNVQVPAATSFNRVTTLSVTANDARGVTAVRFYVDGALVATDTSAPYSIEWDTSAVADGDHTLTAEADDAAGNTGRSTGVVVSVDNVIEFAVTATGQQETVAVDTDASAQAALTVNLATGAIAGELVVSGMTATAAHIHNAFAGNNGSVLLPFEQDAADASRFALAAGAMLDAASVDRLLAGALYVNAHSAAWPGGEVRGQILPAGFVLHFTDLSGAGSVPQVDSLAFGRAAVTLNTTTGAIVVQARVTGLDDATQAHVHEAYAGARGPVVVGLSRDAANNARWFVEDGMLNAAGLDAYAAGRLYVNVHSPANPGGEIRGQVLPDGISLIVTQLRGDMEVPAVDTLADGVASLTLDAGASTVTVHVNTRRLEDASASHLHGAYGGVNGSVQFGLVQDGSNPAHWFAEQQLLSAAQLDSLQAGATYVNVHSPAHTGGEIRGQVIPDGILFAFGRLSGSQVVTPVATDAGGTLAVTVDPDAMTLVAHVNTTGVDNATNAHLHNGVAGVAGGVAIPLTQDAGTASRWSATGVALTADQLAAFSNGRFYANVHTPAYPGGEIRGQVAPPPIEVLFTALEGGQEVPAIASVASGRAATTVNRDTGSVTVHVRAVGADDATASHVHMAFAGQTGPVLVGLQQDPGNAGHWSVTDAQLDADGLAAYLEGRTYVNLHTPAHPGGEIRGQLAPHNIRVLFSPMDGDQVVPPVVTAGSGIAATTVDLGRRSLAAFVNNVGLDGATSAGIHVGDAGANGAEVLPLAQNPARASQWSAIADPLDADSFGAYRAGRLYAQVATPAQAGGEIRGQIVPPDAALFDDQAPTVVLASPGAIISGTVTLEAQANDNTGVTVVRFLAGAVVIGSDTTAPYSIEWDTTGVADGSVTLTAEADDEAGNVGASAGVEVTVQNGSPVTLTQLQNEVFGPKCSGCHTGPTSNSLPGGMDLSSAAASYAALVNVNAIQSALDRVEPGSPDNSYLVRKLDGGPGISGSRMPQGGPYLDAATMADIRQWITDGAPNN